MVEELLKPGDRVDQLSSQGIKIIQNSQYFAFSLDAVLLADFVRSNKRHKLKTIDICAGNGAIGLFLNRKLGGHITEVELQPELADMAARSIEINQLENRYDVINADVKDIFQYVRKDSFDVVTCNPPYFKTLPSSQKNPNRYLAIARHELTINLSVVAEQMGGLLKMNGKGYLVHRPERLSEIIQVLEKNRLIVKRIKFAYPKKDRSANIVLIEVIKDGKPGGLIVEPPLIVGNDNGGYTPEVEAMLNG